MNKEIISDNQGICILTLFIFGSTLVMGTGGAAKNDMWIAILLGIIFTIPVTLIYSRLLSSYYGKDIFDILCLVLGKPLGIIISLLYIWFPFHLGALVLRNFGEFINAVALPETPKIVPMIIFASVAVLAAKGGIECLAKSAAYFIIIVIGLLILFALLATSQMDADNLRPILGSGIEPVLKGAFTAFAFPFGETVVLTAVFSSLKTKKSPYRVYMKSILFGGIFVVFVSIRNILVLGADTLSQVYFPSYAAISRINVGNFLQRLEISVSMVFLLSGFIKLSICLIASCRGISKVLGYDDYRFMVIPVALLMVNLSYIIYDNIMEMFEWAFDVWTYYALPFQTLIPIIVFVVSEIKLRLKAVK